MSTEAENPRRAVLKNVRFSFTDGIVEKKAAVAGGVPKFGNNLIIDPNAPEGPANLEACKKAIAAAEMEEWGKTGIVKDIEDPKRVCFRPGAKFKNDEGVIYNGYEGMVGITGKGPNGGKKRPKLLNRMKKEVAEEDIADVFAAGRYGDAIVDFYCISDKEKGGRGLFCSIMLLRSREEGELFGGGNNASADELPDLEDEDPFGDGAGGDSLLD